MLFAVPPVGLKVIVAFTFTLPVALSCFFLPLRLDEHFLTLPALLALHLPRTPLPVITSVPGLGRLFGSLAVPFFLFSLG